MNPLSEFDVWEVLDKIKEMEDVSELQATLRRACNIIISEAALRGKYQTALEMIGEFPADIPKVKHIAWSALKETSDKE